MLVVSLHCRNITVGVQTLNFIYNIEYIKTVLEKYAVVGIGLITGGQSVSRVLDSGMLCNNEGGLLPSH